MNRLLCYLCHVVLRFFVNERARSLSAPPVLFSANMVSLVRSNSSHPPLSFLFSRKLRITASSCSENRNRCVVVEVNLAGRVLVAGGG